MQILVTLECFVRLSYVDKVGRKELISLRNRMSIVFNRLRINDL
jgi:hypothetical protein